MDGKKIAEQWLSGKMSRRQFNHALSAMGLSVAAYSLAGCEEKKQEEAAAPAEPAATPEPAAATGTPPKLSVFEWAGYDVPEFHPQYKAKYNASPDFPLFASEEEALQKMLGGFQVDIMHPCSYNIKRWREAELLKPIDVSRLKNYADVWPRFKTINQVEADGATWFVAVDCGNSSILYRTDLVDAADVADPSWNLLFNEKYAGRLAMYNTDTTLVEIAGRILGYENLTTLSDEQLETIRPMLEKQRDVLRFYWDDATQIEQAMASGELVAAYAWNGSLKVLRDQGLPVEYMVPKEGILTWVCGLVLNSKGTGDEQAAYDFIDSVISPEAGKWLLETGYGHSNKKSYDLAEPKLLADMGFADPEASFALATVSDEADEPYRSKYIQLVEHVKAGVN